MSILAWSSPQHGRGSRRNRIARNSFPWRSQRWWIEWITSINTTTLHFFVHVIVMIVHWENAKKLDFFCYRAQWKEKRERKKRQREREFGSGYCSIDPTWELETYKTTMNRNTGEKSITLTRNSIEKLKRCARGMNWQWYRWDHSICFQIDRDISICIYIRMHREKPALIRIRAFNVVWLMLESRSQRKIHNS